MKKVLLLFCMMFLLTACGREYKAGGKTVTFNESVDFRHIHYKISTRFDYGSDDNYRSYDIYEKKNKTIYQVVVNKIDKSMDNDLKKFISDKNGKSESKKIKGNSYTLVSYKKDDIKYHSYFIKYNDKEYYRIDFYNTSRGEKFESQFMKYVYFK